MQQQHIWRATHGPVGCFNLAVTVLVVLAVASALDHANSDASTAKICVKAYAARMPFTGSTSWPSCMDAAGRRQRLGGADLTADQCWPMMQTARTAHHTSTLSFANP